MKNLFLLNPKTAPVLAALIVGWSCWGGFNSCPAQDVAAAPVAAVSFETFHDQLAPYGNWIQTPEGWAWQPSVPPGWRPYYDGGHWVNTDAGWYWQSYYVWGDIPFHYGRWNFTGNYGWVWTPGYQFAPAWVCWRHADEDGFCGWAPLPPGAVFINDGWRFHGLAVGLDFDFGLSAGFFSFVAYDHFWESDFRRFVVPSDRMAVIYGHSVFENHYRLDHGRFINVGLEPARMARLTGREMRPENFEAIRHHELEAHLQARDHDREIVRSGGHVEGTRRIEPANRPESGPGRGPVPEHGVTSEPRTGGFVTGPRIPVPAKPGTPVSSPAAGPGRPHYPVPNLNQTAGSAPSAGSGSHSGMTVNNPQTSSLLHPTPPANTMTQPISVAVPGYNVGTPYLEPLPTSTPNQPPVHGVLINSAAPTHPAVSKSPTPAPAARTAAPASGNNKKTPRP